MKQFNLCLLGFGNVARALVPLLVEKTEEMRASFGIEWRVTGVATRRLGWLARPEGFDEGALSEGKAEQSVSPPPANVREWLAAARADVLFETTSLEPMTGQPGIEHIRAGLEHGAHVVTANKGPIVHAFDELDQLARERGLRLMHEATVADCMPVFSLFRECFPAAHVKGFRALLNSTTNIIIEGMEKGMDFEEGVERARALGVTETDPSYDVDGWDSAVKVCALARVLMRAPLKLEEVERKGIRDLDTQSVRAAREANRRLRLVSRAELKEGVLHASVRPEEISTDDPLAMTRGTSLAIHFELDVLHGLTQTAHNPNLRSTAYGLLADFINAVRRK